MNKIYSCNITIVENTNDSIILDVESAKTLLACLTKMKDMSNDCINVIKEQLEAIPEQKFYQFYEGISESAGYQKDGEFVGLNRFNLSYQGFPVSGSKTKSMPQIKHILSDEFIKSQGIKMIVDTCAGGFSVSAFGCDSDDVKIISNEVEKGLLNLTLAIRDNYLGEVIAKATEVIPEYIDAFAKEHNLDLNNAEDYKKCLHLVFDFIATDYTIGVDIVDLGVTHEPFMNSRGFKDVTADKMLSAALTLVVIYSSHTGNRVTFNLDKFSTSMSQFCNYAELYKTNNGSFEEIFSQGIKRGNQRLANLVRLGKALRKKDISFSCMNMFDLLKSLQGKDNSNILLFVDPPYMVPNKATYQNDGFNSIRTQLSLMALLIGTGAKFVLCCDEDFISIYKALDIFEGIHFYQTNVIRDGSRSTGLKDVGYTYHVKECYVTNFDISMDFSDFDDNNEENPPIKELDNLVCDFVGVTEELIREIFIAEGCEHLLEKADFSAFENKAIQR